MRAQEQAALALLDLIMEKTNAYSPSARAECARTIKAMLAEPRMPEELTPRQAQAFLNIYRCHPGSIEASVHAGYKALRAELLKPATTTVEVWHVEFAGAAGGRPVVEIGPTKEEAEQQACKRRSEGATCVRVTGPHSHEVPA